jgi:hypothetical protein
LTDDDAPRRPAPDGPRHSRRAPRRGLALAATAVLIFLALGGATLGRSWSRKVVRAVSSPDSGKTPRIIDDVTVKGDLAAALPDAPQVIVLGGSRSMRFEPSYVERKTGLHTFNAGVPNERPEEAWAMTHFLHDLHPRVRPRYLWFIHVKFLRTWKYVSPGLVSDPRFSRYFPEPFLREQRAGMPSKYWQGDRALKLTDPANYAPDGHLVRVRDWPQSKIDSLVSLDTRRWIKKFGPGSPTIDERCREYFEKTLGYMNELGATPVLVFMPPNPIMLDAIAGQGWLDARAELTQYLSSLSSRYDLTVVDLSYVSSFHGDPGGFYDGSHLRVENTRRVIDEILRRHPHALD